MDVSKQFRLGRKSSLPEEGKKEMKSQGKTRGAARTEVAAAAGKCESERFSLAEPFLIDYFFSAGTAFCAVIQRGD